MSSSVKPHYNIRGLSKTFVDNSVFVILIGFINTCVHIVYLNVCHEIPNQTRVVLNVFLKIKLKFYCIKGLLKVCKAQFKNCSNVLDMNLYSF